MKIEINIKIKTKLQKKTVIAQSLSWAFRPAIKQSWLLHASKEPNGSFGGFYILARI